MPDNDPQISSQIDDEALVAVQGGSISQVLCSNTARDMRFGKLTPQEAFNHYAKGLSRQDFGYLVAGLNMFEVSGKLRAEFKEIGEKFYTGG